MLLHNAICENPNTNIGLGLTIYRGSTNLATGTALSIIAGLRGSGAYVDTPLPMNFIDSPATTSATTYTTYMFVQSATGYYGVTSGGSSSTVLSFIAMEIAA